MTESNEIIAISLSKGIDDDYILYDNGRIRRYHDIKTDSTNNKDWLEAKEVSEDIKQRLLDACPEYLKEKANYLLYSR